MVFKKMLSLGGPTLKKSCFGINLVPILQFFELKKYLEVTVDKQCIIDSLFVTHRTIPEMKSDEFRNTVNIKIPTI